MSDILGHDFSIHKKVSDISAILRSKNFLAIVKADLEKYFQSNITVGAEIEFYAPDYSYDEMKANLPEYQLVEERGQFQYEYHLGPYSDFEYLQHKITDSIVDIKQRLQTVSFLPKPFPDDYGSALQIQISSDSKSFQESIEEICAYFCHHALGTFLLYAHTEVDYARFSSKFMAPTHVSFGLNNRTCLFRINGDVQKRIEIRAPSPLSDPYVVISAAMQTIAKWKDELLLDSAKLKKIKQYKIYGNSFDLQYDLESIPETLQKAVRLYNEEFFC